MTDQAHDYKDVTPLVRAIERRLPENDRMLLEDGANPDGAPLERQLNVARRFRRFHTGDRFLRDLWLEIDEHSVGPVSSQVYPPGLTDDELAERRSVVTQFWTSPFRLYVNHSQEIAEWHSRHHNRWQKQDGLRRTSWIYFWMQEQIQARGASLSTSHFPKRMD